MSNQSERYLRYQTKEVFEIETLTVDNYSKRTSTPNGIFSQRINTSKFHQQKGSKNEFIDSIDSSATEESYKDVVELLSPSKTFKINGSCILHNSEESLIEDQVFYDTSYVKLANYPESDFRTIYKLNGSCSLQDGDINLSGISEDNSDYSFPLCINHQKRSLFRHNRRDWYLNRRIYKSRSPSNSIMQVFKYMLKYILLLQTSILIWSYKKLFAIVGKVKSNINFTQQNVTIISKFKRTLKSLVEKSRNADLYYKIMISLCSYTGILQEHIKNCVWLIYKVLQKLFLIVYSIITYMKDIMINLITRLSMLGSIKDRYIFRSLHHISHSNTTVQYIEDDNDDCAFLMIPCCLMLLILLLAPLLTLILGYLSQVNSYIVPDPSSLGIANSRVAFLGTSNHNVPSWHFFPHSPFAQVDGTEFEDKSPIVFYLRGIDNLYNKLQISIFQTLVSLGYHVVVPVHVLADEEIFLAWNWVKKRSKSSVYLWGNRIDSHAMTNYAKGFCSQMIPPSGVIIETEIKNKRYSHRSLEMWSCNCTSVKTEKGDGYHRYTHVKCSLANEDISQEQLYSHVLSCIEAVNRGSTE